MISKEHSIYKYRFFFKGNAQGKRKWRNLFILAGRIKPLSFKLYLSLQHRSVFILLRIKTKNLKRLLLLPGLLTSQFFSDSLNSVPLVQLCFPLFIKFSPFKLAEDYFSALPSPSTNLAWIQIFYISTQSFFSRSAVSCRF